MTELFSLPMVMCTIKYKVHILLLELTVMSAGSSFLITFL